LSLPAGEKINAGEHNNIYKERIEMSHKIFTVAIFAVLGLMLTGCNCSKKECNSCGKFVSASMCDCMDFINTPDPCADGTCSAKEREQYFFKGYACAKKLGMVPVSPKYGLPAIECPVERTIDANSTCPPACEGKPEMIVSDARTGFLFTAFDTPAGVKYILIEADQKFNPEIKFTEVAMDMSQVAEKVSTTKGTVAVYSTEFPLVTPPEGMESRLPSELEVSDIKQQIKLMGKKSDEMLFIRWK